MPAYWSRRPTSHHELVDVMVYYDYARHMSVDPMIVVVIAANVLGGAMAVPQAVKLRVTGLVEGVSVPWAVISAVVNLWWGIYAMGVGDWSIIPVSVVSVLAYLAIATYLVRSARSGIRSLIPVVGAASSIAAVPSVALWLGGWVMAGLVLGALYGIQLAPAVVGVYRAIDVTGVSLATWLMAFAEAALWGLYGFDTVDPGLLALAATGLLMSVLVIVRLFMRRQRRSYQTDAAGLMSLAAA